MPGRRNRSCSTNSSSATSSRPASPRRGRFSPPQGKPRWRQARISFLKNRPYHQHVTEYLTLLGDEQVPEILRVRMAEALAWFNLSVRRHEIADAGRKLLARGNCSPELAKEVQRMINRVESKK